MNLQLSAALIIFIITIATSLVGLYGSPKVLDACLFRPYWFLRRKEYHTVITSGLVHGDLMHLLFNMMTFYFFAFMLERYIGKPSKRVELSDWLFVVVLIVGLLALLGGTVVAGVWVFKQIWEVL